MAMVGSCRSKEISDLYEWVKRTTKFHGECKGFDIHCHVDDLVTVDIYAIPGTYEEPKDPMVKTVFMPTEDNLKAFGGEPK